MLGSLTNINACTGVSIRLYTGGMRIAALTVSRNGKRLDLGKRIKDKAGLAALMAELPSAVPVSLNITGKGVLHKEVEGNADSGMADFSRLVPGADADDFYFQFFTGDNRTFISMVRKTEIDHIIQQLKEKGLHVIMLSFGAFPVDAVMEQLNQYGEELVFDGHEIALNEDKEWKSYRFNEDSRNKFQIKLGVEQIDEQLLLPYSAAFQALLHDQIAIAEVKADIVQEQMKRLQETGSLKKKAAIVLAAAFIILFLNTFLFIHLNTENAHLQDSLSLHSTQVTDISALAEKTAKNEELVKAIGYTRLASKARLVDQIAALMPDEIRLSAIDINPMTGPRAAKSSAGLFRDNQLIISGSCPSILPVNEWLARIASLKWASHAELRDYGLGDEEPKGAFTIIINF